MAAPSWWSPQTTSWRTALSWVGSGRGSRWKRFGWSIFLCASLLKIFHDKNPGGQNGWGRFWCCGDSATLLDGLGGHRNMASHLPHRFPQKSLLLLVKFNGVLVSGLIILFLGLSVQACCTGRGIHHEQSLPQVPIKKTTILNGCRTVSYEWIDRIGMVSRQGMI